MKITKMVIAGVIGALSATTAAAGVATLSPLTLQLPAANSGMFQGYLPALACAGAGECVAGGTYNHLTSGQQGVLFEEQQGVWLSGTTVLAPTSAQNIQVLNVSCPAAGSCRADGTYNLPGNNQVGFVISQSRGTWGVAHTIALPRGALGHSQLAQPHAISCPTVGSCAVVGTYVAVGGKGMGFVENEVNGRWLPAANVALPVTANLNPALTLNQVSCWRPGACVAVGSYVDNNQVTRALTVSSSGSVWRPAQSIVMPPSSSGYAGASLSEVTCLAQANCTAIGTFNNTNGAIVPMAVSMVRSTWASAVAITLPANASKTAKTFLWGYQGISCSTRFDCAFGGNYVTTNGQHQGFLVNETGGVWQTSVALPLPPGALYAGPNGGVIALSCTAPGTCTAAAAYVNSANAYEAMLLTEAHAHWGSPQPLSLPRPATSVGVDGGIYGLVCFSATSCQVTGTYLASGTTYQAFALQS